MVDNLVPDFFWIGPLIVTLILRPVTALVLLSLSIKTFRYSREVQRTPLSWSIAALYALLALFFFLGLFIQYAALIGILFTGILLATRKQTPGVYKDSLLLYLLLDAVFLSLFVTGAGPLSLDSPL